MHMNGFARFFAIAVFGGLFAMAGVALGLGRIAHAEAQQYNALQALQAKQERLVANLALPRQIAVACPMSVSNRIAQGVCFATYSLPPRSTLLVMATPYAGSPLVPLPMTDAGNPISALESGNVRVSGSIIYASVWFVAPEAIVIATVLRNDSDEIQTGTASVRVLMTVPETTTAAVAAATVE